MPIRPPVSDGNCLPGVVSATGEAARTIVRTWSLPFVTARFSWCFPSVDRQKLASKRSRISPPGGPAGVYCIQWHLTD